MPIYDPKAMEDLAPAERLRLNQEISRRAMEDRQRMIEEMVAAEKERDPDALDEDIREKVNKKLAGKKNLDNQTLNSTMTHSDVRKSK